MRKSVVAALAASALVAGCGGASEEAMNAEFDRNFTSSCVTSASAGLPEDKARAACDCALAEINEKYSASEKIALSDEQAMPIAERCFSEVMQQSG
jgi:hypothetical protein